MPAQGAITQPRYRPLILKGASVKTIHIDPDGDLLLRVGSDHGLPCNFKVCSAAMRRASPVWKNMLFGRWAESKPAQSDWVLALPDDKPWPMRVFLDIVHGNFGDVPKKVEITELYDIVVLADKYFLHRMLQPWVAPWVGSVQNQGGKEKGTQETITGEERLMRIHAAWELGSEELLSVCVRELIWGITIISAEDGEVQVAYQGGDALEFEDMGPPDLLERVTSLRISLIQTILNFFNREIDTRTPTHPNSAFLRNTCQTLAGTTQCNSIILGSIWQHFQTAKEDVPPRITSNYPKSASFLFWFLSDLFSKFKFNLPTPGGDGHRACTPQDNWIQFEAAMKKDKRWKNVLQEHHNERLSEQRAKIGL